MTSQNAKIWPFPFPSLRVPIYRDEVILEIATSPRFIGASRNDNKAIAEPIPTKGGMLRCEVRSQRGGRQF
jgi:hypothetical protein